MLAEILACEGKVRYRSYRDARKRLMIQRTAGRFKSKYRKEAKVKPYCCPHCQSWHVGNDIRHKPRYDTIHNRKGVDYEDL